MSKNGSDESRHEVDLFMPEAADAMADFYEKRKYYPTEWHHLEITFVNGPYHLTDPDIRPTREMGRLWKPRDCDYTYRITLADQKSFVIDAVNAFGAVEFTINQDLDEPRSTQSD